MMEVNPNRVTRFFDPRQSIAIPFTFPSNLEVWDEDPWELSSLPQTDLAELKER